MGEWGREEGLETPMPGPLRAILPPPMAAALILGLGAGCAGVTTGLRPQADVPAATAPGAATAGAVPQAAAVAEPSPPAAPPPADVVPQRRPSSFALIYVNGDLAPKRDWMLWHPVMLANG
jgi:hypothetical protein